MAFPFFRQYDLMDCGPACLRMVARYYGRQYSLQSLREKIDMSREGVSLLGISETAEALGFRTMAVKISFDQLFYKAVLPCIVHWQQNHFIVVYRTQKSRLGWLASPRRVFVADPALDLLELTEEEFLDGWVGTDRSEKATGVALLIEPTPALVDLDDEPRTGAVGFSRLYGYLWPYRSLLIQLVLGMLVGSGLQLILPFLTQSIVDVGINTHNIGFIHLVLFAQLALFAGRTTVDFIRSWILLHVSARINLQLLSDFFIKLMKLPMSYFDVKMMGDIMQRVGDHQRVENFLTGQTLSTLFSVLNLVVFGLLLAAYNSTIFLVFLVGSVLYGLWVKLFMKQLRKIDYRLFDMSARSQGALVQLIQGMQEIKLHNCEKSKRWEWEQLQLKQHRVQIKTLALSQYQQAGAFFIHEGKNIFITFLSAQAVIEGNLTLGGMLSVQYIIGQLNSPIEQLIRFAQSWQEAQISLERLNEIHQLADEEPVDTPLVTTLPARGGIRLQDVTYSYPGAGNGPVLQGVSLRIPPGKITAIVGSSGSGKTTLLKLLLKVYDPTAGEVLIGEPLPHTTRSRSAQGPASPTPNARPGNASGLRLSQISHRAWRRECGVVMQDGFIFSDTILRNIAVGDEYPDPANVSHALRIANLQDFIDTLPLGLSTKIGAEGNGLSQGQKQRILIARAVYKNPQYIFLDEATNALDANNERIIQENLNDFFRGRTVIVVAHRLSTVKHADQIILMDKGRIAEIGTHAELTARREGYFHLVRNQLELGN
ncbi:peptidase domain-containing ABC transporter [Spirosoma sordidisoli]|uniref:Peptidase domain-containing ABC transporter n=1 Tax=Spirosoma sordidisoli TaxID=2502893 RepID=A0A4V1RWB8_9BACT|nr:peptidase domain-containing ABC transporter [Spirosoma sordidisoli]RYC69718.1 peptidase domain-containing ABC transporter [Spirosoma sordidisoli]